MKTKEEKKREEQNLDRLVKEFIYNYTGIKARGHTTILWGDQIPKGNKQ